MTRRVFLASFAGETRKTFAWNSAIRATEDMARAFARGNRETYSGGRPEVLNGKPAAPGAVYTRDWTGDLSGNTLTATVREWV